MFVQIKHMLPVLAGETVVFKTKFFCNIHCGYIHACVYGIVWTTFSSDKRVLSVPWNFFIINKEVLYFQIQIIHVTTEVTSSILPQYQGPHCSHWSLHIYLPLLLLRDALAPSFEAVKHQPWNFSSQTWTVTYDVLKTKVPKKVAHQIVSQCGSIYDQSKHIKSWSKCTLKRGTLTDLRAPLSGITLGFQKNMCGINKCHTHIHTHKTFCFHIEAISKRCKTGPEA